MIAIIIVNAILGFSKQLTIVSFKPQYSLIQVNTAIGQWLTREVSRYEDYYLTLYGIQAITSTDGSIA